MKITITRVKKYNAQWNNVVCVDGLPVAIAKSMNRAGQIAAYIQGMKAEVNDGTLKKQSLNKWRDKYIGTTKDVQ
ncbi:hypothetical protein FEZ51_08440 [Pediococcus stilesii]|jgi:hypothetical protein|uniref:Uncharacterized protein n=1 Tax=Pediococcus stilesii TaxID=331679 RepID=A0A5R9BTR5_9LACO|nr:MULTISPECIES: hypothetical protein [Pediococcus]RXI22550.1 hypothetical protein EPT61_02430 [Pediococcus pentosaceus]TLQ03623.1 hypothetical protein FEZ51_08440 [Pediococcus stilesii]